MTATLIPWGPEQKQAWFKEQEIQRSYRDEVLTKIEGLKSRYDVKNYGALSIDPSRYPVFVVRSKNFDPAKKTVLVTGGVHGYETSGVQGALAFLAENTVTDFNIVCFPCISPWAYETINRWNNLAIDPNRTFHADSPADECRLFLNEVASDLPKFVMHIDLHETTDTDNSVFRPAKAARDGKEEDFSEIPDGFYLVGDTSKPAPEFQRAIIQRVKKVTHIAPPDAEGNIIGAKLEQEGVINYDKKKLFLCGGVTDAPFVTTTEVYPDSPKATPQICIDAQVAAIEGGLAFLRR